MEKFIRLKKDIINAAKIKGINPYQETFSPKDIGLNANKYGSFSDYCSSKETKSGKWNKHVVLKVAQRKRNGNPYKYLLLNN